MTFVRFQPAQSDQSPEDFYYLRDLILVADNAYVKYFDIFDPKYVLLPRTMNQLISPGLFIGG